MVEPSDRMKMDRDHHVPPSDRAVEILREQMARRSTSSFGDHPYVFEGERPRQGLSNMALLMIPRRMKVSVTAHGFRAGFRSWCADRGIARRRRRSSRLTNAHQRSSAAALSCRIGPTT